MRSMRYYVRTFNQVEVLVIWEVWDTTYGHSIKLKFWWYEKYEILRTDIWNLSPHLTRPRKNLERFKDTKNWDNIAGFAKTEHLKFYFTICTIICIRMSLSFTRDIMKNSHKVSTASSKTNCPAPGKKHIVFSSFLVGKYIIIFPDVNLKYINTEQEDSLALENTG